MLYIYISYEIKHCNSFSSFSFTTFVSFPKAPRSIFADYLYQVIHNIQDVLYGRRSKLPPSRSLSVYDIINSQLTKLHNNLKKYKVNYLSQCSHWTSQVLHERNHRADDIETN